MATPAYIDPAALMRIQSLELRAKVIVEGMWKGMHRSPYHGFSVEFSEYRSYAQGDDPRYIDWKVLARSDRCFIKKFEDETNLRCQLVVDHSRSMQFGSGPMRKADFASTFAATLALFLMRQGDAVGLTTFGSNLIEHIPARNRPGQLRRIMVDLEKPAPAGSTALDLSVQQLADLLRKRGLICLISDLLAPVETLERQLGRLGTLGHDIVLFHVMDPAEVDFHFDKPAQFRDIETGTERFIDPASARESYLARFEEHCSFIRRACERQGIEYHACRTDKPLEQLLFDFISGRTRTGAVRRKTATPR